MVSGLSHRNLVMRLMLGALATYELRTLISSAARLGGSLHGGARGGPASMLLLALLVAGTVWMLRESARGLGRRVSRSACSSRIALAYLMLSLVLIAGSWVLTGGVPMLLVGVLGALAMMALSVEGARWALKRLASLAAPRWSGSRPSARPLPPGGMCPAAAPAPLLAGWSDRGPPARRCALA